MSGEMILILKFDSNGRPWDVYCPIEIYGDIVNKAVDGLLLESGPDWIKAITNESYTVRRGLRTVIIERRAA